VKTSVHHKLDIEQAKLLKKLDIWLIDNMLSAGGEDLVMKLRELITEIEEKGYYDTPQKELLNELRYQYMKDAKEESK
jgi:hypothetical protein|tara:strand:+ start:73 stop:306 length:234 start_codon:yes stop_codon:yes gene_type:complete